MDDASSQDNTPVVRVGLRNLIKRHFRTVLCELVYATCCQNADCQQSDALYTFQCLFNTYRVCSKQCEQELDHDLRYHYRKLRRDRTSA